MTLSEWITMMSYWDLSDWLKNISEFIFVTWSFVPIILLTPVAACLLRSSRRPTLNLCATLLLFFSGAVLSWSLFFLGAFMDDNITRVTFWHAMTKHRGIWLLLVAFWVITAFNLLIWTTCELYRKWRKRPHPVKFPNRVLLWTVPILILLSAPPAYFLPKYQTLQDAVESGDVELVKKRLAFNLLGVTANTGYIWKWAASSGTSTHSLVPLAAGKGNVEIVKLLLKNGGSLRETADRSDAFSEAEDNPEMTKCLLEYTKDANDGLWAAVEAKQRDTIELFLSRGADPFAERPAGPALRGITLFELPDLYGHRENQDAVEILTKHTKSLADPRIYIYLGEVDNLKRLLDSGMDPNALYPSSGPEEPLLYWTTKRIFNIAYEAQWHNAVFEDFNKMPGFQRLTQYCDAVDLLLAHGADPNIRTIRGETPLHVLARAPRLSFVGSRYPSDTEPFKNWEQMDEAVSQALLRVARALVEHGGDPRLRSGESKTSPMDIIKHMRPYERNEQILEYFHSVRREQKAGAAPRSPRPDVQK